MAYEFLDDLPLRKAKRDEIIEKGLDTPYKVYNAVAGNAIVFEGDPSGALRNQVLWSLWPLLSPEEQKQFLPSPASNLLGAALGMLVLLGFTFICSGCVTTIFPFLR
ncbi:MAG: hypothetical protein K2X27_01155 [Candidatus Obscuribacterales bacterium]|nr:hypothetical protein [Candidatus Obscuribacterales bacterium]